MADDQKKMLIILTSGPEDRGNRATLAFSMGVTALFTGVETTLYMTMGGTFWSRKSSIERVRIDGFEPLKEYVEQYRELGGKIVVCSPCDEFYWPIDLAGERLDGSELVGLTYVVDVALDAAVISL
jgi:predicted peroxiredoxin